MFLHRLVSKLSYGNITLHAADLTPNRAKHWLFTSKCLLPVSRPISSFSLIHNLLHSRPIFFLFPNSRLIRLTWLCHLWLAATFWKNIVPFLLGAVSCCSGCKIHWQGHVKRISRELGNSKKMGRKRHAEFTSENTMLCAFAHFGISCELGNRKTNVLCSLE